MDSRNRNADGGMGHLQTPGHQSSHASRTSGSRFGFTSIQDWSRRQHALMLEERQIQLKTGRIIPQANEEYGYEDHDPHWAPKPDADFAETLRRCAWARPKSKARAI